MNAKELRDLKDDELVEHIKTSRRDAFGLRFQLATGELRVPPASAPHAATSPALTIARERRIDPDRTR